MSALRFCLRRNRNSFAVALFIFCLSLTVASATPPNRAAAQQFTCQKITALLSNHSIVNPIGLSTEQTAELVRRIVISGDWSNFEGAIIAGSRTHHSVGHKPESREDGSISSDIDIQLYPNKEWRRSASFDREIYPVLDDVARTLRMPPYTTDVELPRTELIQRRDLLAPISDLVDRMSSNDIEARLAVKLEQERSQREVFLRGDEKKFWLRELFKAGVPESALHTTEAIVILRDQGAATASLKTRLERRGFRNILVIPSIAP